MVNNKILRKFGFKPDQQGIINRYMRESSGWNQHLNKTKDFILQAAQNKTKGTAVIMGSGWLLDVPMEKLSTLFEKLVLVDIVHPRQIEHKVKKKVNVELLQSDITGLVQTIYSSIKDNKKGNYKPKITDLRPRYCESLINEINRADFVVSVNILNQLDILICDYIKKFNLYNEIEIEEFRKFIQSNHLHLLPKSKSTLITDFEELNLNDSERIVQRKKLVYIDLPNSKNAVRWNWEFDMQKTYHADYKTVFKVVAVNC